MPVVYIDVLFVVNLIINYLLLLASSVFTGIKINKFRVLAGSLVGAVYAVFMFFPNFSYIYSTFFKMLISMLIVAISFSFYTIRSYLKTLIVFYIVSFGFGGCVLGVFYFSDVGARLGAVYSNGILYFNLPWTILLISWGLFFISIKLFGFFSQKTYKSHCLKRKIILHLDSKSAEITALLDTGNSLVDPVTLTPVIIVEYKLIKELFCEEIKATLNQLNSDNLNWILDDVTQKGLPIRLIPFSSIGKENGMLLGFVPDNVEILDSYGVKSINKCVVALYDKPISSDRSYGALLNPYL